MKHQFESLSGRIIQVALDVHARLGPGFLESIYENAICLVLVSRGIDFARQVEIEVRFDGITVGRHRIDLIVEENLVVELKAVRELKDLHFAQLRSYLQASGLKVGLLCNFTAPTLVIRRVVLSGRSKEIAKTRKGESAKTLNRSPPPVGCIGY